ncbi:glycosyl hydrolase family 76 [Diaporthe helianthi]|uniref:Mannan endo-1,6-alpha-mannosidase n=1 Tax=Diaporthe helianthi TaxID=158607 RepID=A0A2P5IFV5_DIAHE|nr:glycosyl hydrolase family 76 [Diaporthe helianthi]
MDVDFESRESIKNAAYVKAKDVMSFYHGQEPGYTLGLLSGPAAEHWWEAGALWGTMIDYWKYTSDRTYNDIVQASLLSQVGPDRNFMEPNVSAFMGNDDQGFWGLSAMLAAESNFQNPAPEDPQWLTLAQAVFDTQTGPDRRDSSCGGGLRWQVFAFNGGYDYKNSISNGLYFNLAARLARYTGNEYYAQHAAETFEWLLRVGLIDGDSFDVFDGAHVQHECRDINRAQFSYNVAVLLHGAAFMYDFTHSPLWAERVNGLLDSMLRTFFIPPTDEGGARNPRNPRIAFEPACEGGVSNVPAEGCTHDMLAFKGFGARWMATTAQLCPWTRDRITPVLRASAEAAVRQCVGGANGRMCGMQWALGVYDGSVGVGQEMNVLSALMVLLAYEPTDSSGGKVGDEQGGEEEHPAERLPHTPLTHDTGGTSEGNPDVGETVTGSEVEFKPITRVDVTSAAILTSALIVSAEEAKQRGD